MRLPLKDGQVDNAEVMKMVDTFLDNGFNYFDTAYGYLGGKSQIALRECLTSHYPRDRYILANKLSSHYFNKAEEIRPLFESQLEACGVDYFDFYLMHAQDQSIYAIRFAASFDNVMMVLSGMGNMDMLNDNISYMKDFKPLTEKERDAIDKVCAIFRAQELIPCTACRYCMERCPKDISIPDLFACLNPKKQFNNWNADYYYNNIHTKNGGKANSCIECGLCETVCPQHLKVRALLKEVSKEFDK